MKNRVRRSGVFLAGAISGIAASIALPQTASGGTAPAYPNKPIRLIVPFAPGGGLDIFARVLAQKLGERIGQSVVVDNRAGGTGIVGANIVAKAVPDGYTLIMTSTSHTIVPSLFAEVPYDALKDFAPVTLAASQPYIVGVHPALPAKSLKDLIALAKSKPGQLNYASGGNGTVPHLAGEQLKILTRIDMVHVPYKGGGPALLALISGEVAMLLSSLSSTLPQVKAGKIRALAVSSAKRSAAVPDLPTVAESGVPDFEVLSWYGLLAPAKTPKIIVDKMYAEVINSLQTPEIKERLANDGNDPVGSTPEEFTRFIRAEIAKWGKLLKTLGVRVD